MDIQYKYVEYGSTFIFEGQEYRKTSFKRGCYYGTDGRIRFRRFKNLTVVHQSEDRKWITTKNKK